MTPLATLLRPQRRLILSCRQVEHSLDKVTSALNNRDLHRRRVWHWRIVHAKSLHGRVQEVEALLRYSCTHGHSDASGLGALVEDRDLVRALQALADGDHAERFQAPQFDEVDVESLLLDLLNHKLCLLDAVEVGEDGHGVFGGHALRRGLVQQGGLVQRRADVELKGSLRLLHHFHGSEQEARPVVADHALGDAVGRVGRGGRADLQPGDARDVRAEGLAVLGAERLVGGSAPQRR